MKAYYAKYLLWSVDANNYIEHMSFNCKFHLAVAAVSPHNASFLIPSSYLQHLSLEKKTRIPTNVKITNRRWFPGTSIRVCAIVTTLPFHPASTLIIRMLWYLPNEPLLLTTYALSTLRLATEIKVKNTTLPSLAQLECTIRRFRFGIPEINNQWPTITGEIDSRLFN